MQVPANRLEGAFSDAAISLPPNMLGQPRTLAVGQFAEAAVNLTKLETIASNALTVTASATVRVPRPGTPSRPPAVTG